MLSNGKRWFAGINTEGGCPHPPASLASESFVGAARGHPSLSRVARSEPRRFSEKRAASGRPYEAESRGKRERSMTAAELVHDEDDRPPPLDETSPPPVSHAT